MLNWNYFEVFIVLSETLSFSEAAKKLNSSQPVVSRQIQALEAQMGQILFFRTQRKVQLTKEGLDLKRKLAPLVGELNQVLDQRQSQNKNQIIPIRIASTFDAGERLLMPQILKIMKAHPKYQVSLDYQSAEIIYEKLLQGQIDFGFSAKKSEHKSIIDQILFDDEFILIGVKNQKQTWSQLTQIPMVYYKENDPYSEKFLRKNLTKQEQKKTYMRFCANSHRSMIEAVKELGCFAVIPKSRWIQSEFKDELEVIKKDTAKSPLFLVYHNLIVHDLQKIEFRNLLVG